ncbi:MAG: class I SAM-dependent methyltransferase [Defluviitaleaceae bacterium]|nr:class I SAM-dependent methyltransferase [Defluviitaleaceae bacterium]
MNDEIIEKLYDIVDEMTMLLVEHGHLRYLDALCGAGANIVSADVLQEVDTEIEIKLFALGKQLNDMTFEVEEVRKALQLALLKGLKADYLSLDTMTPDAIAMIVGYLINKLISHATQLNLADFVVGTGNLLTATLNTLEAESVEVYGVDDDYQMLALSKMMADMQDYDVQFFHQSSASALAVPKVDVIIGDLPIEGKVDVADLTSQLAAVGCDFLPYLLIENHLDYLVDGGYGIYVINNDFFSKTYTAEFHQVVSEKAEIGMLLQLPETLFKEASKQKSILVVKKHQLDQVTAKEVLVGRFPNPNCVEAFHTVLTKIEKWITMNKWERN